MADFLEKKIFPDIRCTGKKGEKCEEKTDSNFDRMLSGGSDSFSESPENRSSHRPVWIQHGNTVGLSRE